MKPANVKLSLVTGKVERDASFRRLVDSIIRETTVEWEFIVADASVVPFESDHERITVLHEKPRLTHSKGYNRAFRKCEGEFILWLNDDAEVCEGYDVESIAFMEAHPQIGLGCLCYSERGGPFHVNSAWGVMYANFGIFRRQLGHDVGFFDEAMDMYGADNAFTLRILLADRGVAAIPAARVLHHSEKDDIRIRNQAHRERDTQTLYQAYMPVRQFWTRNYRRHEIKNQLEIWPHGVRAMVTA